MTETSKAQGVGTGWGPVNVDVICAEFLSQWQREFTAGCPRTVCCSLHNRYHDSSQAEFVSCKCDFRLHDSWTDRDPPPSFRNIPEHLQKATQQSGCEDCHLDGQLKSILEEARKSNRPVPDMFRSLDKMRLWASKSRFDEKEKVEAIVWIIASQVFAREKVKCLPRMTEEIAPWDVHKAYFA